MSVSAEDETIDAASFFVTNIVDSKGVVVEPALVALDTAGANMGDVVLVTTGAAARMPSSVGDVPVDATIIGVVTSVVAE